MLGTRILTALVVIPIVICIIIYGKVPGVYGLISAVIAVGLYEYLSFLYRTRINVQIIAHIMLGLLIPFVFFYRFPTYVPPTLAFILVSMVSFSLFNVSDPKKKVENLFIRIFGIFYVSFLLSFLIPLRALPFGGDWVIIALVINFGTDAGAYFAGRFLGKHKLYPAVSPKKTVEGAIGGVALCTILLLGYRQFFFGELRLVHVLVLGVVGSMLAILGDLAESLIKRGFEVKDAGVIVPGHGGILDRIDSFVFSVPFIYYYAALCFPA